MVAPNSNLVNGYTWSPTENCISNLTGKCNIIIAQYKG